MVLMRSLINFLLLVFLFQFHGLAQENDNIRYEIDVSKNILGTIVDAKLIADNPRPPKALVLAFKEMERIDSVFSMHKQTSVISKINRNAGIKPVKVNFEVFSLIRRAINYSIKYDSLFDISVGPITNLWGFSTNAEPALPHTGEIKKILPLVGFFKIRLNDSDSTCYLPQEGMMLDLGGLAKGYAVDRATKILKSHGYRDFMINAGGDVYVSGHNKYNKPWTVGIKHPRKENELIGILHTTNCAIATSGDYERFFIENGTRYHHILYPKTGMPGNLTISSTVVFENAEEATVLTKYLFLLGYENFQKTRLSESLFYLILDTNNIPHFRFNSELNFELTE